MPESMEFPSIHSFPPFFTRQPNDETFAAQRQQWAVLILSYHKSMRTYVMGLSTETLNSPLFTNGLIGRSLKLDTLREIVEFMVSNGQADYTTKKKESVLIYWRTPTEWAKLLEEHIAATGQNGVVLTIYELTQSDEAQNSDFYNMDKLMLRKVIDILTKKGKAFIMKGSDGEEQGIKFY